MEGRLFNEILHKILQYFADFGIKDCFILLILKWISDIINSLSWDNLENINVYKFKLKNN